MSSQRITSGHPRTITQFSRLLSRLDEIINNLIIQRDQIILVHWSRSSDGPITKQSQDKICSIYIFTIFWSLDEEILILNIIKIILLAWVQQHFWFLRLFWYQNSIWPAFEVNPEAMHLVSIYADNALMDLVYCPSSHSQIKSFRKHETFIITLNRYTGYKLFFSEVCQCRRTSC